MASNSSVVSSAIALHCTLLLALGAVGCRGSQPAPDADTTAESSLDASAPDPSSEETTPSTSAASAPKASDSSIAEVSPQPNASQPSTSATNAPGTLLNPPQSATLKAVQADAQINLRSQPTTQSSDKGYGLVGDAVTLLRSAQGEGDYTWYYVTFETSAAEGWIRGDFIEVNGASAASQGAATEEDALGEALDAICGGPENLNTYYNTQTYNIYICNGPNGLIYIGNEKGTSNTVVSQSVTTTQTGFSAQKAGYTYSIDSKALTIYEGDRTAPLVQEPVEFAERY